MWQNSVQPSYASEFLQYVYRCVLRLVFRYLRQFFTGKSDLERLLSADTKFQASITGEVEKMIEYEELPNFPRDWIEEDEPDLAEMSIAHECYEGTDREKELMKNNFQKTLVQIRGHRELLELVENKRSEAYDKDHVDHEKRLLKLWRFLMPNEELENRRSYQWQKIGFQGDDPSSDFRGMGILSLDQLLFLAQYDATNAQEILLLSNHPTIGFPMALTGIAITSIVRSLLRRGYLKNHFYNTVATAPSLNNFNHVYCRIFVLFAAVWKRERPSSIMRFSEIRDSFENSLCEYLQAETANLDVLEADQL